ncbi:hypothetical protein EJB05_35175, partial [Eragrostis curvula]
MWDQAAVAALLPGLPACLDVGFWPPVAAGGERPSTWHVQVVAALSLFFLLSLPTATATIATQRELASHCCCATPRAKPMVPRAALPRPSPRSKRHCRHGRRVSTVEFVVDSSYHVALTGTLVSVAAKPPWKPPLRCRVNNPVGHVAVRPHEEVAIIPMKLTDPTAASSFFSADGNAAAKSPRALKKHNTDPLVTVLVKTAPQ